MTDDLEERRRLVREAREHLQPIRGAPKVQGDGPFALIGDSHSYFWGGSMPPLFSTCWVGAETAHGIAKMDAEIDFFLKQCRDKPCLFMFGEIDVRVGIVNAAWSQGRTEDDTLAEAVSNYVSYVAARKAQGYRVGIVCVTPPGPVENCYGFPVYPSYERRKQLTVHLNAALKAACAERGIPFADIYHHLVSEDGERKLELCLDPCHMSSMAGFILYRWLLLMRNAGQL